MSTLFSTADERGATFSPCRTYRYALWRFWSDGPRVAFIGLNPSTADETKDDPTIRRCIRFAKDWGFGGLWMLNIFAFRATDPAVLKSSHQSIIGPRNDSTLKATAAECAMVVACWGVHGALLNRGNVVRDRICCWLHCLGVTKCGHPKHPLYLPADSKPIVWEEAAIEGVPMSTGINIVEGHLPMSIARSLISDTKRALDESNWTIGDSDSIWRGLSSTSREGKSADDFHLYIGQTAQFVADRLAVHERFGRVRYKYRSLGWAHFQAALAWPDVDPGDGLECGALAMLAWANEMESTVAEMRAYRRARMGQDLTQPEEGPRPCDS